MSCILGIDTSSVELGLGLVRATDAQPVMAVSRYLRNSHAEHITQCIDFMLETNRLPASEISCAAIAVGPGSFTGLRIGIAFLKGFFFGREARVLPVSSLESMAGSWHVSAAGGRNVVAVSDARNKEVFWARFRAKGGSIIRLTEDVLSPLDKFESALSQDDIVLTDTLGYAKSTAFECLRGRHDMYALEKHPVERGMSCARIGSLRIGETEVWRKPADLSPVYMNMSAPEKKLHQSCVSS
jgi:tRNA threonylcarbamoyladenosine biosynthesis protein TsaB